MSKEKSSASRRVIRSFFNPRAWASYDTMREISDYLFEGFSRLFVLRKGTDTESLDEVMKKLSLDEKDIASRKKIFFRMALLMGFISLCVFVYTMFHLLYARYHAVLLGSVVCLLSLTLTFRYHFWYFQLRRRKLGCTFREWLRMGLLGADE